MYKLKNIIFPVTILLIASCSRRVPEDIIQSKVNERITKYQANETDQSKFIKLLFGKPIISDEGSPLFISKNHEIKIDDMEILSKEEIKISDVTKIKIKVRGTVNTFCFKKKLDYANSTYKYVEEDYGEKKFENIFYAIFYEDNSGWSCDLSIW
jgi:hypothetical protein